MIDKVNVPAQSGNSLDKVRIIKLIVLFRGKMERELASIDKKRTRILLPNNNAPTISEFFLTGNTHNSRNRMYRPDERIFFSLLRR